MTIDKKQRNRKERKELARRLRAEDPGLEVVHPHAAGVDVRNSAHHVAVGRIAICNQCGAPAVISKKKSAGSEHGRIMKSELQDEGHFAWNPPIMRLWDIWPAHYRL
jgi:hypothetical protein